MKNRAVAEQGQVVLITLLVLTIATTVALSLISRTTTDLSITTQVEESSRAFSAAEAGIEQALKTASGTVGAQVLTPGVTYSVNVAAIGNAAGLYELPKKTTRGNTETVWLVPHDPTDGSLQTGSANRYKSPSISVCWTSESTTPALAITVLYKQSTGAYETVKAAFDPDAVRAASNGFSAPVPGGCGGSPATAYKATLTFNSLNPALDPAVDSLIALRLRPMYSDTTMVVDAGGTVLPLQGNRIESTGTTAGGTNRKIVVYQQYRSPSSIFDAALYSEGILSK